MTEPEVVAAARKRAQLWVKHICESQSMDPERREVEVKSFLPLGDEDYVANLAKAIMALCNFGGGMVVVGFREVGDAYQEEGIDERDAGKWSKVVLIDKVGRYMTPVPEIDLFKTQGTLSPHPVIVVHPHHKVPVTCARDRKDITRRGAVYTRRLGPKSEEIKSSEEWATLIRRCTLADSDELLRQIRATVIGSLSREVEPSNRARLLQQVGQADARFKELLAKGRPDFIPAGFGRWIVAYQALPRPEDVSLESVKKAVEEAQFRRSGWPIGIVLPDRDERPRVYQKNLEAWVAADVPMFGVSLDYWVAAPQGFFYATRAYLEDLRLARGKRVIEVNLPVCVVKEAILHALTYIPRVHNGAKSALLYIRYEDLSGRTLFSPSGAWRFRTLPRMTPRCYTDEWSDFIEFPVDTPKPTLSALAQQTLDSFYELFDLFKPPNGFYDRVGDEIA